VVKVLQQGPWSLGLPVEGCERTFQWCSVNVKAAAASIGTAAGCDSRSVDPYVQLYACIMQLKLGVSTVGGVNCNV